jgi:hypothetical protein
MASSYTYSETATFTLTHAKHMAAKVAADLKRMQRMYGWPTDLWIEKYEAEVVELLKAGYLGTVTYGFRRNDNWVEPTLKYTARDLQGASANDDDPGRISPGANVQGATFHSYLTYSTAWDFLTYAQQQAFKGGLPFQRGGGTEPTISGYLVEDRTYSAGGRALGRSSVKSFG